jgi:uncharacterized protein
MNEDEKGKKKHTNEEDLILDDVEIIDFEEMNLIDATVIVGFPSLGMVSTIVTNYLIDVFDLKQIGALDSSGFPALSVVHTGEPLSPVRIYAGTLETGEKIVVFVSEFKPKSHLINSISNTVMKWVQEKNCNLLISPEGMVVESKKDNFSDEENIVDTFAIGSTEKARAMIKEEKIPQFKDGIIVGVSGVLLNIGKQADFDVISILTEAHPDIPDAGSAISALNIISKIIDVEINIGPLNNEAERIEKQLQKIHKQAKPMVPGQVLKPSIYG